MPAWIWWVILYAVFLLLNIAGAEVSFRFAVIVAVLSLAVIALFAVMALFSDALDFGKLFDIEPEAGNSDFLPFGWWQVVLAMPFAMWLYLGIEELPLAAEESHMPARDIPRAGIWGLITLIVSGGLVLVLNPAVTGAAAIGESGEPLLDGFRAILPNSDVAAILSAFALLGLFASLQGIMYAYGRNIYSLSRAGYYPKVLSLTGARKTPWIALVVGAVIGVIALVLVDTGGETAGAIVLNIAVWGAVLAYLLQMVSFVMLRRKFPNASRPYRSPFGVAGAVVRGRDRRADFRRRHAQRGLPAGDHRDRRHLRRGPRRLRGLRPPPVGPVARGGVRHVWRPAWRPAGGGLRRHRRRGHRPGGALPHGLTTTGPGRLVADPDPVGGSTAVARSWSATGDGERLFLAAGVSGA